MSAADTTLRAGLEAVMREAMQLARQVPPEQAHKKAHQDYVTEVDMKLDRFLETELGALTPGCPVLSEERAVTHAGSLERYWIVDPIDGTLNMMSGLPFYGIAAALVDRDGPQLAAVAAVAQDEVLIAERNQGAWLNGQPLRLPKTPPLLIVLSTGLLDHLMQDDNAQWEGIRAIGKIRNLGAQALHLCGVARGQFAAVASVEARVWDEAAAGLILREAGGIWQSRADRADWTDPTALMAITKQYSVAADPASAAALVPLLPEAFSLTAGPAGTWPPT
ncbi:MAG TPA: inositol monophosphatase family protein [Aliiroseovarius sp.]|nr:inositol monophosphatase family protein [Aliiroseovarius sp.]